jgi:hypothetical protein
MYSTAVAVLSLGTLCLAFYFNQTQKLHYNKTREIYSIVQKELKDVEGDIAFLKQNQSLLNFLIKKGWFSPKDRLVGGEKIHHEAAPLNTVRFKVEPEVIKEMEGGYAFRVSKIIIETGAVLDNHIYDFSKNILNNFSGVLVLRKLSISRNENINETNLLILKQNKRPNFIISELTVEWFAMRGGKDED